MTREHLEILLFEKDENLGTVICEFMQMSKFRIKLFRDEEEALERYEAMPFPICIIDIEQENMHDRLEFAKSIKRINPMVVLIFMGTNPTIQVISETYAVGADDFVRKPFIIEELQMRILAIIRRIQFFETSHSKHYRIGRYSLDAMKHALSLDNETMKITTKECELLAYLCENRNNLVMREDILINVWKSNTYYNARSMDVYITKLRRRLAKDKNVGIINVHGKGYKLIVIK